MLLQHLKINPYSDYGSSYRKYPSRIIPPSVNEFSQESNNVESNNIESKDESESIQKKKKGKKNKKFDEIIFKTPFLNKNIIYCGSIINKNYKLPDPIAYFKPPHTLLKSFLYLSDWEFRNGKESKLTELCHNLFLKKRCNKSLSKNILSNLDGKFNTDPEYNPFFKTFIQKILKNCGLILIRSDENNNFVDKIIKNPKKKPIYVILLNYNQTFSPYGTLEIEI